MKTICKYSFFFLALALTACRKDPPKEPEIPEEPFVFEVVGGWITSPQWLVEKVDSIGDRWTSPLGVKFYPRVYLVKYNEQDYICIINGFLSNVFYGHLYFTSSGKWVDPDMDPETHSPKLEWWWPLEEERSENGVLLWSPPPLTES